MTLPEAIEITARPPGSLIAGILRDSESGPAECVEPDTPPELLRSRDREGDAP